MPTGVHATVSPSARRCSILIVNWNSGATWPGARRPRSRLAPTSSWSTTPRKTAASNRSRHAVRRAPPEAAHEPRLRRRRQRGRARRPWRMAPVAQPGHGNPRTEAIARLRQTLRDTPSAGAVGGCPVDEHGRPQQGFAVRRFPTLLTWACDLLLLDNLARQPGAAPLPGGRRAPRRRRTARRGSTRWGLPDGTAHGDGTGGRPRRRFLSGLVRRR